MARPTADILRDYGAAWLETDKDKRRSLLENSWAENGVYQDPTGEAVGREALVQHIGGIHRQVPGARIELTSGHSEHHGKIYFSWRMTGADGNTAIEGVDFGMLDTDGRLKQIVGFFGPPPRLK